jgi:hypothetical protein
VVLSLRDSVNEGFGRYVRHGAFIAPVAGIVNNFLRGKSSFRGRWRGERVAAAFRAFTSGFVQGLGRTDQGNHLALVAAVNAEVLAIHRNDTRRRRPGNRYRQCTSRHGETLAAGQRPGAANRAGQPHERAVAPSGFGLFQVFAHDLALAGSRAGGGFLQPAPSTLFLLDTIIARPGSGQSVLITIERRGGRDIGGDAGEG